MDVKEQQILEKFRKMVLAAKDLNPCTENNFLIKFLRSRRYDCDKSLQLLRNYYKLRHEHANLYTNFSPKSPKMMALWDSKLITILPTPDKNGRKIILVNMGKWNLLVNNYDDVFISFQIIMEVLIAEDEETQKNGALLVVDLDGIRFGHAIQCVPSNLRKTFSLFENSFPLFLYQIHLINQNAIFKLILSLGLPLVSNSMRRRMILHGRNMESLHQYISPCSLPVELGGSGQCRNYEEHLQMLFKHEEYLLEIDQYGYK